MRRTSWLGAAFLVALSEPSASAQTEPIPGYFELQVAFCWGMYAAMIPFDNQVTSNYACLKSTPQTPTFNCQEAKNADATWENETNELRYYLFTGTADHGGNSGVMIAIARGRQFASEAYNGSQSLPLDAIKNRFDECRAVVKELPY